MSCECDCGTLEIISRDVVECFPVCTPTILEIVGRGPQGIQGPAGSLSGLILAEAPSGLINTVNLVYTTIDPFTAIWVYLNGLRMKPGSDYNVTDIDEITFTYAPTTGDTLLVDYIVA